MDGIYSFLNLLLPFEWAEFDFMKNALLAVLMITPLFGSRGTRQRLAGTLVRVPEGNGVLGVL